MNDVWLWRSRLTSLFSCEACLACRISNVSGTHEHTPFSSFFLPLVFFLYWSNTHKRTQNTPDLTEELVQWTFTNRVHDEQLNICWRRSGQSSSVSDLMDIIYCIYLFIWWKLFEWVWFTSEWHSDTVWTHVICVTSTRVMISASTRLSPWKKERWIHSDTETQLTAFITSVSWVSHSLIIWHRVY